VGRVLVEPVHGLFLEVVPGAERLLLEEVVEDQAEGLLDFPLSIRISHGAREGVDRVMTREVEECRMPDRLAIGAPASENRRGHVVQDQIDGAPLEVLERACQSLQERVLPLVTEEGKEQLAAVAQDHRQRVNQEQLAADLEPER
jgi:hypothetical protein